MLPICPNVQSIHHKLFIPLMYQSRIFSLHYFLSDYVFHRACDATSGAICKLSSLDGIFGAAFSHAFSLYFIKLKNAIVAELGRFNEFLSHERERIVISLFRCN